MFSVGYRSYSSTCAGTGSDLAAHHQALVTALNNGHGQITITKSGVSGGGGGGESPTHTGLYTGVLCGFKVLYGFKMSEDGPQLQ